MLGSTKTGKQCTNTHSGVVNSAYRYCSPVELSRETVYKYSLGCGEECI